MSDDPGPLQLSEDANTGDRFLIYQADGGTTVELQFAEDTFWASQRQMAEAFGVTQQSTSLHKGPSVKRGETDGSRKR